MSEATWIERGAKLLLEAFDSVMAECSGSFAEREVEAMKVANSVMRLWTKRELERIAGKYDDEIRVDGQLYRRHAGGTRRYHTLYGAVEVERDSFRLVGVHNGPTVVPLELEAEIIENATPALAFSVVQAFATMPLRQYEDEMRAAHRVVPSRSTLERIAKRVGRDLHEQLPVIEPMVRANEKVSIGASSISVGIDRTTIPMAEAQPPLPERWHRKRSRKRKRRQPPVVTVAYRMAYVATMAVNDERGNTIASKRIAATADEGPIEMMERLGAELEHVLDHRPDLPIVIVQDGAPELWNLVEEWFSDLGIPIEMKLIDRYHLCERLGQIVEVIERDQNARWRQLDKWRLALDRSDTAIKRICKEIEDRIYGPPEPCHEDAAADPEAIDPFGGSWEPDEPPRTLRVSPFNARLVEGHIQYCKERYDKMRYGTARRRGFPVGSGVTEGACKSVIASRMKRSGQRWFEQGASACLQLRTLHLNERLERAFRIHRDLRREMLMR